MIFWRKILEKCFYSASLSVGNGKSPLVSRLFEATFSYKRLIFNKAVWKRMHASDGHLEIDPFKTKTGNCWQMFFFPVVGIKAPKKPKRMEDRIICGNFYSGKRKLNRKIVNFPSSTFRTKKWLYELSNVSHYQGNRIFLFTHSTMKTCLVVDNFENDTSNYISWIWKLGNNLAISFQRVSSSTIHIFELVL